MPKEVPVLDENGKLDPSVYPESGTGSGDMQKSTYDSNDDGIVDLAAALDDGVSGKTYNDISGDISGAVSTHAALPDAHHAKSHAHDGIDGSGKIPEWLKIPKVMLSFYGNSKFSYDGTTLSWGPDTLKLWINNISKNIAPGSIVIPADFHYIYVTVDDFVTPGVLITLKSIIYTGVNTLTEKDIIIGFVSKQGVGNEARFNLLYGLDHEHEHDGFDSHTIDYSNLTGKPTLFDGAHGSLSDVSSDQHHAKSHAHNGLDGSGTVAHADTTGQTTDDHHAKSHAHDGVDGSGTVEGTVVKSTGETGGAKYLRENGDGTCSWQTVALVGNEPNFIWVSHANGNDVTGDGTINKPFATIQRAVDVIDTDYMHRVIIVDDDETALGEAVTFPDLVAARSCAIAFPGAVRSAIKFISTLTIGNGWSVFIDDALIENVVESLGCAAASLVMENGVLLAAAPNLPNVDVGYFGTMLSSESAFYSGTYQGLSGYAYDVATNKVLTLGARGVQGTDIRSTGQTGGTKVLTENGTGGASWQTPSTGDPDAIHDNVENEINSIATSLTPADADVLIAEDADAVTAWSKAKLTMSNLYNYIKAKTDLLYASITHASTHSEDGADEITVQNLGSGVATEGEIPAANGTGGLSMAKRFARSYITVYRTAGVSFPNNDNAFCHMGGAGAITATEAFAQVRTTEMKVSAITGYCNGGSGTFTVRKNGADTTLTGTVNTVGQFLITNDVDFAEDDMLSLAYSSGINWTVYGIQLRIKTEVN